MTNENTVNRKTGKLMATFFVAVLALMLIFTGKFCGMTASAEVIDSGTCGDNLTWTLNDEGLLKIEGNGSMDSYYWDSYDGRAPWYYSNDEIQIVKIADNVTSIGNYAFYDCTALTSIEIPNSVTNIGHYAFYDCKNLKSITIPNNVGSIYEFTFCGCTSLTSIEIPSSVTNIGYYAFEGCTGLTSVTIPNSVTSIGYGAFEGVKKVIFAEGTTAIPEYALRDASSVMEVVIPNSVTSIGSYAFYGCTGLTSIEIPDSVTSIGGSAFYGCSGLTSIEIPDSVTSIGDHAFAYCTGLTSIEIPSSVTGIGPYAFSGVKKVIFAEGTTAIPEDALCGASSVTEVVIPDGVTSIGDSAFLYCTGLTSIEIPSSVTSIGSEAFVECTGLKKVNITDMAAWCKISFNDSYSNPLFYAHTLYLNDEMVTAITIPDGVTSIGESTFEGCTDLTSIEIPNSVTSIGGAAFYYCTGLTSIEIPGSVISIGDAAFLHCTGLTSIEIPSSVTSIGDFSFGGCTGLTSIVVDDSNTVYNSINNCNAIIETKTDKLIAGCKNTVIPNSVTSIGESAFEGCTGLTSITIPSSVTSIGDWAFCSCSSLASIEIPSSVTIIGGLAFSGCTGLTSIELPDSVTSIGGGAFEHCTRLTSIEIPSSVTSIGDYAFSGCTGLTSIAVDSGNTIYDSRNDCNAIIEIKSNTLIAGCKSTIIPNSVTSIGEDAFYLCTGLTSIEIPSSVTSIGSWAFSDCTGLTSITIPSSVTSIGSYAFFRCDNLTIYGYKDSYAEQYALGNDIPFVEITDSDDTGLANFTVVNAQTKEPIVNAQITVTTEDNVSHTYKTDENGKASATLPIGKIPVSVSANGCITRNIKVNIEAGENNIPLIGLSDKPTIDGSLTTSIMSLEEIEKAGIDTEAFENNNVIKYETEFEFKAKDQTDISDTRRITASFIIDKSGKVYIKDGDDYVEGNKIITYVDDEPIGIYIGERFFLVIYGEVKWLKEMFDVEMHVWNNSATDTLVDIDATLELPDGLSLATMLDGEQTLTQHMDEMGENGSDSFHWYVRGDKAGEYKIGATLSGMTMPFEEEFTNHYETDKDIVVYSGDALQISFNAPLQTKCGYDYDIEITLENVSDRSLYNVSHIVKGMDQFKITHYLKDGTVVKTKYAEEELNDSVFAKELKPGEKLVITVNATILFRSEVFKDCIFQLVSVAYTAESLSKAMDNHFGYREEHDFTDWYTVQEANGCEDGVEKRDCKTEGCGYSETNILLGPGHDLVTDEKAATCEADGYKKVTCDICKKVIEEETYEALGHNFTGEVKANNNGTHSFKCVNGCEQYGEPVDCDFGAWQMTTAATCESGGMKQRTCATCSYAENEVLFALGHSFTNYISDKNATCLADGTKTAKCDYEGCTQENTVADPGSKLNHSYTGKVKANNDGTHSFKCVNGCEQYGEALDCSGGKATCKTKAICSICKAGYGELADHTPGKPTVKNAICKSEGSKITYCSVCNAQLKYETIPMLSHSYTGKVKANNDGTHSFMCINGCGNYGEAAACADNNRDHKCDTCAYTMSVCKDENSDHYCEYCGKKISNCVDKNKDNRCDICGRDIPNTTCLNHINPICNVYESFADVPFLNVLLNIMHTIIHAIMGDR